MMRFIRTVAAVLACCLAPGFAAAQAWPTKSVRIVVPFAAGGATDVVARLLSLKLTEAWGQNVVVENRLGAGGNIGADSVAKAPPDGYTLLLTSGAIVTASQHMYKSLPFDPAKDLVAITNVATGPQLIAVATAVPVKDLRELIAYAKANPKRINYGSAGIGSQTHLAAENFAYAAGIELTHVPYKGESAALTDLMGGQIQLATPNFAAAVALVREGKIRALAVTSKERNPQLPDVPPAAEVLADFENAGWFGLMAPAGTPREVIEKVARDSARITLTDEFRARLAQLGMEPVANTPAEFTSAIRVQSARWEKVIRERGIKAAD
ncbi:MAG: tripartite tricarboxylate transporter substrate binding protein [Burkholderiales bacterium]|nr:tripartite tricarboxylate transporter substrate binding protein [Burkholderiales bacterium]